MFLLSLIEVVNVNREGPLPERDDSYRYDERDGGGYLDSMTGLFVTAILSRK